MRFEDASKAAIVVCSTTAVLVLVDEEEKPGLLLVMKRAALVRNSGLLIVEVPNVSICSNVYAVTTQWDTEASHYRLV